MKEILKKNFEKCKEFKSTPDAAEPLTCGTDEEYAAVAADRANVATANSPEAAAELAAAMLEDLLANMPVTGADAAGSIVTSISTTIASFSEMVAISSEITEDGLLITNADGSTVL